MEELVATVMVVEDDETLALGLVSALELAGFGVRHFDNGEDALEEVEAEPPDLAILDVMLPGMDGIELLTRMKKTHPEIPVILLTAKGQEDDRVLGLEAGADDYVTKPFSVRELIARVKARLRALNVEPSAPGDLALDGATVDLKRRIVAKGGVEERLTTHEAGVLAYLAARAGTDVSREELLEKVWGYSPNMNTRTVDNQILKLRKKLEGTPANPRHILTVHGKGYRFEP
jgi:DNA-binding response OmpR family regulator